MMTALLENEHPTFVLVFIIYVDPTRGQIETFRLCIPGVSPNASRGQLRTRMVMRVDVVISRMKQRSIPNVPGI
jgi:hypothetical protein